MTPETQAAIGRVQAFLEALNARNADRGERAEYEPDYLAGVPGPDGSSYFELRQEDVETLLAASTDTARGPAVTEHNAIPAAALAGCTVMRSVTIFYPVHDVPDYESSIGRVIRPRQVKIHATRINNGRWQIASPAIIGPEVLKNGALGSIERKRDSRDGYWPDWLGDIVRSVRKALEAELDNAASQEGRQ